jgi:glycosyltransferase involved in cell wall biosynthesis
MKTRIINILAHQPDYDFMQDKPRPAINWDTPQGSWVGIYRNEIPDKLGEDVLRFTDEFEYEVWQPDYRADKMYSHRFEDGLVHRLFPAKDALLIHGLKIRKKIHSQALLIYLLEYAQKYPVIININGAFCKLNFEVLEHCGHLPVLQTFRGMLNLPLRMVFKPRLNLPAALSYYFNHLKVKKLIKRIDHITVMNKFFLDDLKKLYNGPVDTLTSGCDFNKWQPMDLDEARKALGLPQNKTIFFTSSLLIPIKQIDKLIQVLKRLDKQYDFLLLISGHGVGAYEQYLRKEAEQLLKADKVRFVGYLSGIELRRHYCASNVFVHPSISEGGPGAAMKAIACGTPVMITKVSNVAEHMLENGSGQVIDPFDYEHWEKALEEILQGKQLEPFPREQGKALYDWQGVAEQFVKIYRSLAKEKLKNPTARLSSPA